MSPTSDNFHLSFSQYILGLLYSVRVCWLNCTQCGNTDIYNSTDHGCHITAKKIRQILDFVILVFSSLLVILAKLWPHLPSLPQMVRTYLAPVRWLADTGMSGLDKKCVRLAPNGTNLGLTQIRFQYLHFSTFCTQLEAKPDIISLTLT